LKEKKKKMSLKLFNTLTRKKEEFISLTPGKVNMYVCGPTVYNDIHIGNARPFIFFDVVRRYLEYRGYDVTYILNFTDVDDKMIRRAEEMGLTVSEIAERYIKSFYQDIDALGIPRADCHPRVTEHIEEIVVFIKGLEDKGFAYQIDGDVYYRTVKFKDYGKLSHQNLEELRSGARIEVDARKENPLDFALWKKSKGEEIGWDSPWGHGRPGWHIECSAMARKYLGDTLDIHAGGHDLTFPHHENEIAQSEALTEKPFANYWLHNGFINMNNEKMSKSLGNLVTVAELRQQFRPEVLRLFMLSTHYRNPINYSDEIITQTENALQRLENSLTNIRHRQSVALEGPATPLVVEKIERLEDLFVEKMDDDFNTADAITVLFELAKEANLFLQQPSITLGSLKGMEEAFVRLGHVLGLLGEPKQDVFLDEEIEKLIIQRTEARKNKDWARADEIRDLLTQMGILLEDTPQGIRWKRK
jgi:cysteinyl-tRNA synthetase